MCSIQLLYKYLSLKSESTIPDFDQLLNFVQQRCKILENLKSVNKIDRVDKSRERPFVHGKSAVPTKSVFNTIASTSNKSCSKNCCFCDHCDHNIHRCPKFNELSVEKRRDFVASRKLCFACLSPKHMVKSCPSKSFCRSCDSKNHNSLLHIARTKPLSTETTSNAQSTLFAGAARTNCTVVLGTAIVHIYDVWGRTHAIRALLDSGSQISTMTDDCLARLCLPKKRLQSSVAGLAQKPVAQIQGVTQCQFSSHFDSEYVFPTVDLVILSQITSAMPSTRLPSSVRGSYQHLLLADKDFDIPARIDVLFGADIFPSLVRPHAGVEHYPSFPSALDTKTRLDSLWILFYIEYNPISRTYHRHRSVDRQSLTTFLVNRRTCRTNIANH